MMRAKPAGAVAVKVCAAIGLAATVIVLRDVQNDPLSTRAGAARSVRSSPVVVSVSTPRSKVLLPPASVPPTHCVGTEPMTFKVCVPTAETAEVGVGVLPTFCASAGADWIASAATMVIIAVDRRSMAILLRGAGIIG